MVSVNEYKTVETTSALEFDEKKSRFIGVCTHVENTSDIDTFLEDLKKNNKDAKHIAYAYVLGKDSSITKNNDDNEPAGTAGTPIFNAMREMKVTDTLVAVVRYFGGIKLGKPKLARAYHTSALECLKNAKIVKMVDCAIYALTIKYPDFVPIGAYLRDHHLPIISAEYGDVVSLRVALPSALAEQHISELKMKLTEEFLCSKVDSGFFKFE